jgi:hypothetical protein
MSFVAAAGAVGAWAGIGAATSTAAIIGGGAMIGAGVGGAYSALTGDGKILDSMLTGAGIGGLGAFGLNAAGVGATTTGVGGTGIAGGTGVAGGAGGTGAASQSPALFAYNSAGEMVPANYAAEITGATNMPAAGSAFVGPPSSAKPLTGMEKLGYGLGATTLLGMLGGKPEGVNAPTEKGNIRPYEYTTSMREPEPGQSQYFQPIEYDQYGKATTPIDTSERNYFNQQYTPLPTYKAAQGGQIPQLNNMPAGGLASIEGMRDGYGAMQTSSGNIPQFADGGYTYDTANQRYNEIAPQVAETPRRRSMFDLLLSGVRGDEAPQSFGNPVTDPLAYDIGRQYSHLFAGLKIPQAEQQIANRYTFDPQSRTYSNVAQKNMAEGGVTNMQDGGFVVPADTVSHFGNGSTDAGLKLLSSRLGAKPIKGRGDGMSDSIAAMINGKQPARIADGEAYVPPEMVKKIGKGSPEAGAKRLYNMMDKVRHARTGTKKQGKQIKADKYLPT